jgi:hypothetical protein
VALLLLPDALLELLEHLVEVELPEGLALLVGELPDLDRIAQPGEQLLGDLLALDVHPAKVLRERYVEVVEVLLVVDEQRARDQVESVEGAVVQAEAERPRERHGLPGADRHLASPQVVQEVDEHRGLKSGTGAPRRADPRTRRCLALS